MKKSIIFLAIISFFWSCDEDFLEEKPEDFLSSANAFNTYEDFTASVNNMYYLVRRQFYNRDENRPFDFLYGTDLVFDGEPGGTQRHGNMVQAYDPAGDITTTHWNLLYKNIAEANTVIERAPLSEMSEEEINDIVSQARFFRGFSYNVLVTLYGGVPLVTEAITEPKIDFVRNSREEVLNQVIDDLSFAAAHLPGIAEAQDGRVNKLVAYHYLGEAYLALGNNTEAIAALSKVIDDGNTGLMTERFGTRSAEEPGDVFWDLFRRGNQNRASGNTEAIWVIQFEVDVQGGGLQSGSRGGSYPYERHFAPLLRFAPFTSWPVGDYTGGRGIGWGITTEYYTNTVWGGDASDPDFANDIRNANHNFVRVYNRDNSSALALIAEEIGRDTVWSTENQPRIREFYAYPTKVTTPYNHPDGLYRGGDVPFALTSSAGGTYTDQYMVRLAETYLLRAEAYLANNQPQLAADDLNVIRNRANASEVAAGDVTLDYILDERVRELGLEEKRRLTLMRTNTIYDRVMKYNPFYVENGMQEHFNLWPIPADEIEGNRGAELVQNPGYN
ncbi:RagB/SusD family nutrient uptake outer membrane protein [Pseudozobellia thermophila]|uniref:Starch-binding associating with outer membrane n=1 Tax=Pseudozobellia thermophila TaxID=192903 RepID=A0A1M6J6D7_9FLAO|nr:RagB/SusD family nutrient uptake outer membrane protein [Pseudozobellia thermophila]SHJ42187.1 Starch-binding associating with outer membrane [Pseudozobellia thermophila]